LSKARVTAGQVVLLTGSGQGLVAVAARALARAGMSVHVTARSEVQGLAAGPVELGNVVLVDPELRDPESTIRAVVDTTARLDAWVHCASPAFVSPLWQLDEDAWRRGVLEPIAEVHRWMSAVLPVMRSQRYGQVVLLGPAGGLEPNDDRVAPSTLAGALLGLAESLAYATMRFNVDCHVLRLGARPIDVGAAPELVWPELGERLVELLAGRSPAPSGSAVDLGSAGPRESLSG
jgi:NAD(P)-dependent dehydrogenase (short-subunit alcohol dehydrogenase family)